MNACPTVQIANLVGKKWTFILLEQVAYHGTEGFNTLLGRMRTISPKILSHRLRELEEQKIVVKAIREGSRRKRTSYSLTSKGIELLQILNNIKAWNARHCITRTNCPSIECVDCPFYR